MAGSRSSPVGICAPTFYAVLCPNVLTVLTSHGGEVRRNVTSKPRGRHRLLLQQSKRRPKRRPKRGWVSYIAQRGGLLPIARGRLTQLKSFHSKELQHTVQQTYSTIIRALQGNRHSLRNTNHRAAHLWHNEGSRCLPHGSFLREEKAGHFHPSYCIQVTHGNTFPMLR